MTKQPFAAAGLLAALGASTALAQAPSPPPDPCTAPESHQFDFWIGDWDVFRPDGASAGTNRIARLYGCMLHESWKSSGGYEGQSFNGYDAKRGLWHQTWVDSSGRLLLIEGTFKDGAMRLSDAGLPGKKDGNAINEITWTPNADGTVRQHWRASTDGGNTWKTVFDGKYVKAKP